jgi:hypothetical protein
MLLKCNIGDTIQAVDFYIDEFRIDRLRDTNQNE